MKGEGDNGEPATYRRHGERLYQAVDAINGMSLQLDLALVTGDLMH